MNIDGQIMTAKTKPFNITRIPALNGEWIDLHVSEDGKNVYIDTSGYADVKIDELIDVLESLKKIS